MRKGRLAAVLAAAAAVLVLATPAWSVPPFDGNPISPGLGPTYGEAWCAPPAPGTSIANQQGPPLALIPYEAFGCTLAQIEAEGAAAGLPDRMDYSIIGTTSGGRNQYGVVVNALETPAQQRDYERWRQLREIELTNPVAAQALLDSWDGDVKMPIFIQANIHGDEEEGADAIMQVIRDLVTTPYGTVPVVDKLLDHAILVVIPNENPDGRFAGTRSNGNGFDMNRDFLVQSQAEVRNSVRLQQQWLPTVGLDLHGYVSPTLIDGLTKPHNPGLEYDLFLKWNQRRLDANEAALAAVGMGITRPVQEFCPSSNPAGSLGFCNQNNILAAPNGATQVGNTVTITTTANHSITPGITVTIANVGVAAYNGTWTVDTAPTARTFTYTNPTSGLAPSGGGQVGYGPQPSPAVAEGWDDWGPFYTQTYMAFLGSDSSTLEMCSTGPGCNGRFGSKRAQYVGFYSSVDYWIDHREGLMYDQVEVFRRGVSDAERPNCCDDPLIASRGFTEDQHNWMVPYPRAYVIPQLGGGQRSDSEANRLVQWLLDNGIQVTRATAEFTHDGTTYPAGSYVVWMNQALRGLALTTLSAGQDISDRILQLYAPPGAWSHGYLWGADVVEVPRGDLSFAPATAPIAVPNTLDGGVRGGTAAPADWYSITLRGTSELRTILQLLRDGVYGELAEAPFTSTTGGSMPAGSLIFPADSATAAALQAAGQASGLWFERNVGVAKPATTRLAEAPKVAILVNSGNPARSDTSESLRAIFGPDAAFVSVVTGTNSLQNASTDPLLGFDVIYNAGQAYPAATNATARARLNAFFARGGGYIGTSQSNNNFTFLTGAVPALVTGLTQSTQGAFGGIAKWSNVGAAASPLTGGYPAQDYLYLNQNVTYFSATPADAAVDGRYLPNTTDMFIAGHWLNRTPAAADAPMVVRGNTSASSRYMALAANPFSRQDAEREWPLIGQAALWSNLTDEASSTVTFPTAATPYNNAGFDAGCGTAAGDVCGSASAGSGPALGKVQVALRQVSSDLWWDGSAFASSTPVYHDAVGTSEWSFAFPAAQFPSEGDYVVRSKAIGDGTNEENPPTSVRFTIDRTAPAITITTPPDGAVYLLDAVVEADYECEPAGLVSCDGPVPDGDPIDTASVGFHDFTVTSSDDAGNTGDLTHTYQVVWPFTGFLPPVANPPALNNDQAGSSTPMRFSLGGNRGLGILAAGNPESRRINCSTREPLGSFVATQGTLTFVSGQYTYTWKTQKGWDGTCREFSMRLVDESVHRAYFRFR